MGLSSHFGPLVENPLRGPSLCLSPRALASVAVMRVPPAICPDETNARRGARADLGTHRSVTRRATLHSFLCYVGPACCITSAHSLTPLLHYRAHEADVAVTIVRGDRA
jgi:hypothetical protein